MVSRAYTWLNKNYPQNFILQKPYIGTLIFLAYCFAFVVIYKPLSVHQARFFSFEITMAIYLAALSLPLLLIIKILKKTKYFSNPNEWTFLKEVLSVAIILLGMGISVYFIGFLVELPSHRWNLSTFFDSCTHAVLVGMIPFLFFSAMNYRHLFVPDISNNFTPKPLSPYPSPEPEKMIRIASQLKKEELNIFPSQVIYAESDGNYVVFHLNIDNQIQKKIIRNSISNIEKQLSIIPFLMRTHRAFIVNVKQVISQKGNTLGYRLKLNGTDDPIPVSRQNTHDFDQLLKQYR